jgi:cytochrome P450
MTGNGSSPDEAPASTGFADPTFARDPQAAYRMMRQFAPVVGLEGDGRVVDGGMAVGLHGDVVAALRTPEVYSSSYEAVRIGQVRPLIPLQLDPPDQLAYRKLLDPLFAPKRVAQLEAPVRELARTMVEGVAEDGRCNFNRAIAEPFPSMVFLELLGLPVSLTDEFIALKDGIIRPTGATAEEREAVVAETGQRIYAVLEEVLDARTQDPQDDFISGFLTAEVEGRRLSRDEVVDICYLFFLAGLDTVTASLDCMLAFLAQHPDHRRQVAEDRGVVPRAVEELLRWETPVPGVVRRTTRDAELSACPIPAGTQVFLLLGSANTDESVWDRADEVDFDREVNRHLAFGGGVHRCLGSHLARLELRVMLEEWHARVPDYALPPGTVLDYSAGIRQIDDLPLVWEVPA